MIPQGIQTFEDLTTSKESTTAGFIEQAREKARRATEYVERARDLSARLREAEDVRQLLHDKALRDRLLTAVGLSEKALSHLDEKQRETILLSTLAEIEKESRGSLADELTFRFLLTSGDSLGGTMRNVTGAFAKDAFAKCVIDALAASETPAEVIGGANLPRPSAVAWRSRVLVFDRTPKIVGKNIDAILLSTGLDTLSRPSPKVISNLLGDKDAYIACGEVKGGIDPAGADEHWKTAHAALERIRTSFGLQRPALFYAGAAIEANMAKEILSQLRDNRLTYAANLTKPKQVWNLAKWLISL